MTEKNPNAARSYLSSTTTLSSDLTTSTLYSSSSYDDSLMLSENTSSSSDNTIHPIKINPKQEMFVRCIETKQKKPPANRYSAKKIDSNFLTKSKIGTKHISSIDQIKAKGMPLDNIKLDKNPKSLEQNLKVRVFIEQPNKNKSVYGDLGSIEIVILDRAVKSESKTRISSKKLMKRSNYNNESQKTKQTFVGKLEEVDLKRPNNIELKPDTTKENKENNNETQLATPPTKSLLQRLSANYLPQVYSLFNNPAKKLIEGYGQQILSKSNTKLSLKAESPPLQTLNQIQTKNSETKDQNQSISKLSPILQENVNFQSPVQAVPQIKTPEIKSPNQSFSKLSSKPSVTTQAYPINSVKTPSLTLQNEGSKIAVERSLISVSNTDDTFSLKTIHSKSETSSNKLNTTRNFAEVSSDVFNLLKSMNFKEINEESVRIIMTIVKSKNPDSLSTLQLCKLIQNLFGLDNDLEQQNIIRLIRLQVNDIPSK